MLKSSSQKRIQEEDQHSKPEPSYSPLHLAAIAGDDAAVEVLLLNGADRFDKDNKHGNTALHEAAWRGYSRCVKLLCTLQQTPRSSTKKFGKSKAKSVKHVEDEWKNQTYLNTPNAGGFSPLHLAAQNGHNQSCREILLAGADPDVKNNYGDTPLHTSCRYGHAGSTRILISAKCDPVCVNLNYDTPLHIACAMGRRKLTRILYEVCGTSGLLLRNAQGEAPRDISLRKNLKPIIEILNAPPTITKATTIDNVDGRPPIKSNQHRCSSGSGRNCTSDSDKIRPKAEHSMPRKCINDRNHGDPNAENSKIWSPYGCHYFPDPRTFPPPKLETFPKEPLQRGEQYYLDLAGNIRKGPVGIGNTCYCGPFFNHIEQQINQNKKSFKKYVLKATGKLDGKVQELAKTTDDKIQKIARSIMAEHCEKHGFDYWPKRNDPLRATVVPQLSKCNKDEMNNNTLSRCRSLEFLEDRKQNDKKLEPINGNLYRSFDLLNHTEQHEAIIHSIHQSMLTDADTSKTSSMQHSTNTSESGRKSSARHYSLDFRENYGESTLSDAESLEDFTNKTMEIIQMKRATRQKFKDRTIDELRERQKVENSFLKYPPNFSSTLTSTSIDDLRDYHASGHYPNDFDDISVEMKNITKLLSASLIEPLESTPSTSSSFYQSTAKLSNRFTLYNKEHNDDDDDESSMKSDLEFHASNSYISRSTGHSVAAANPMTSNGFFQNTCFENQSSSSCDTLKSVELPKVNGNATANTNGINNDDESDTDSVEPFDAQIKTPAHLQTFNHLAPRPGLVSARIKSLLAKNMQTTNKMPTLRSTLVGNSSTLKSAKRVPLKSNDPLKLQTSSNNTSPNTSSTNHAIDVGFMNAKRTSIGKSSENEGQITIHKATVHANQIQTDLDERTNN